MNVNCIWHPIKEGSISYIKRDAKRVSTNQRRGVCTTRRGLESFGQKNALEIVRRRAKHKGAKIEIEKKKKEPRDRRLRYNNRRRIPSIFGPCGTDAFLPVYT